MQPIGSSISRKGTRPWPTVRLGDLVEIKHGFAFKGDHFTEVPNENVLLTPGNFKIGGGYKGDKLKYYSGSVDEGYILHESDLIVTMTDLSKAADTLGYPALIPHVPGRKFLHNQRLGRLFIKDKNRLDLHYLYFVLCSRPYRNEVLANVTGTTVKHTSPKKIAAFTFAMPPLHEQRHIAHILSSLDDKIELNRKMNETLEQTARATFKSWFVDFLPVRAKMEGRQPFGMDSETAALFPDEFEESELGEIPRGWGVSTLQNEYEITMGQSPPGGTYNFEKRGLPFFQGKTDFGFRFPTLRMYCSDPRRIAQPRDTLVSVRAPVGDMNIAIEECCIGRGLSALRHKSGFRSYTYYHIRSLQHIIAEFEAEGTVFGSISKKGFEGIKCLAPPVKLTQQFEESISPLDELIENNEKESGTLMCLRDALLPKLMSGEIMVNQVSNLIM